MSRSAGRTWLVLAALVVIATIGYLRLTTSAHESAAKSTEHETRLPPLVQVTPVRQTEVTERFRFLAELHPLAQVDVIPKVTGRLIEQRAQLGDQVTAGQLLARVETADYDHLVSQAKSNISIAKAELAEKVANVRYAEQALERGKLLSAKGGFPSASLEQAQNQLQVALAGRDLSQARLTHGESELARVQLQQTETEIRAPISGFISAKFQDAGQLANSTAPVVTILDLQVMRTQIQVLEVQYPRIEIGQTALLHTPAYPGEVFTGKVTHKSPLFDPLTRTAQVEVEVDNASGRLKAGMHGEVELTLSRRPQALVVPVAALTEHDGELTLVVCTGKPPRADFRTVQLGVRQGLVQEILTGITAGELVTHRGHHLLEPNQVVRLATPEISEPLVPRESLNGG